jgi:hypothetical protein
MFGYSAYGFPTENGKILEIYSHNIFDNIKEFIKKAGGDGQYIELAKNEEYHYDTQTKLWTKGYDNKDYFTIEFKNGKYEATEAIQKTTPAIIKKRIKEKEDSIKRCKDWITEYKKDITKYKKEITKSNNQLKSLKKWPTKK